MNGTATDDPDRWVDPLRDRITLDGKRIRTAARSYILLHKPKGYLTTRHDPLGRPTVYDLLGEVGEWLAPVGRLDLETSGLLILTNDTAFGDRVTDPEHKVAKTYRVKTARPLAEDEVERLRRGVELRDGLTRPAVVRRLRDAAAHTVIEIVITEGRNRQVRRMLEAVGNKVAKLVRTAIGPVGIGDLPEGGWRRLTAGEVAALGGGTRGGDPA